jgi:malate dehydrogenase (oxaloacetate-decarboxylating)(NADP+)
MMADPARFIPILYDPTVADACLTFGPLYRGLRQPPPAAEELEALTEEFVQAGQQVLPGCCLS